MREFSDFDEAIAALKEAGEGWLVEEVRWRLREMTFEEHVEQWQFESDALPITIEIPTCADLHADEMTDDDWISLGKAVAQVAHAEREWRSR